MIETYIPLYRKYRPQSFADLVGQGVVSKALGNAIEQGKIAHAYLLTGPRGTGKTSSARILAKSLNCVKGPTITPCQLCPSCQGITEGNDLDVIEFDAASNNSVEQARELIESCRFAPMAGRYKIYIIDEVHMLSTAAFNALLKTLEEPPPGVIFIFATTEAHKVLPTIVSRCQRFDFTRITTAAIKERLSWICEQEGIPLTEEARELVARSARGGMRDALSLLDQLSVLAKAYWEQDQTELDRARVLQFLGLLNEEALVTLTQAIAEGQPDGVLQQLEALSQQGIEAPRILQNLMQHLRFLLLVKTVGSTLDAATLDVTDNYLTALQAQAPAIDNAELPQMLLQLGCLEGDLRRTQDPQLLLEVGLLGLAFRDDIHSVRQLTQRLEALEARLKMPGAHAGEAVSRSVGSAAAATVTPVPAPPKGPAPLGAAPMASDPVPPSRTMPSGGSASMPAPLPVAAPPSLETPSVIQLKDTKTQPEPVLEQEPVTLARSKPETMQPAATSHAPQQALLGTDYAALHAAISSRVSSTPTRMVLLQQAFLETVDENRVIVACKSEPIFNTLNKPDKLSQLQAAVDGELGPGRRVELVVSGKKANGGAATAVLPQEKQVPAKKSVSPPSYIESSSRSASPAVATIEEVKTPSSKASLPSSDKAIEPALKTSGFPESTLSALEADPFLSPFDSAPAAPSKEDELPPMEAGVEGTPVNEGWMTDAQEEASPFGVEEGFSTGEKQPKRNASASASMASMPKPIAPSVSEAPQAPAPLRIYKPPEPGWQERFIEVTITPTRPESRQSGGGEGDWDAVREACQRLFNAKPL